jgi:hypothetical protein
MLCNDWTMWSFPKSKRNGNFILKTIFRFSKISVIYEKINNYIQPFKLKYKSSPNIIRVNIEQINNYLMDGVYSSGN